MSSYLEENILFDLLALLADAEPDAAGSNPRLIKTRLNLMDC